MRRSYFFALVAVVSLLIVAGCKENAQFQPANQSNQTTNASQEPTGPKVHVVEVSSSGLSPDSLSVKRGDTVMFVNRDSGKHWPASDVHPTHGDYPEPGGCIKSRFDACRGLSTGESFSFVFNVPGKWAYHDHINPGFTGTIAVT
ncbi:hypothetical protein HY640_02050 [Candidatus Woesearchaeota archaeon]|nr:hypothetical protein [Candidatus Woesearchaeota archaeon]